MKNLAYILVIVGAINWGLVALGYNLVSMFTSGIIEKIMYAAIGLSGVYLLISRR